jgi:flavin reductase
MLRERFRGKTPAAAPEIAPARFRQVMGRFASGVTVITAEAGGEIRGMTASAFMSGSLAPPLCVVAIAKRAHMHGIVIAAGRFAVNMLASGQGHLSTHFAGRPIPGLAPRFCQQHGVPVLEDVCARIVAQLHASHDCGDHTLFIGRVLHLDADDRPPLVVHAGHYASLMYVSDEQDVPSVEFW